MKEILASLQPFIEWQRTCKHKQKQDRVLCSSIKWLSTSRAVHCSSLSGEVPEAVVYFHSTRLRSPARNQKTVEVNLLKSTQIRRQPKTEFWLASSSLATRIDLGKVELERRISDQSEMKRMKRAEGGGGWKWNKKNSWI